MMKKLRHLGSKMALSALCSTLLFASGQVAASEQATTSERATTTTYAYKITVSATMPKGFAGATLLSTQPASTKFTPCSSATALDGITFTVTYDAGKTSADKRDVYLILYNPEVDVTLPVADQFRFFTISKPRLAIGQSIQLNPYIDLSDMNSATLRPEDIYIKTADNPGIGAISEAVFGGNFILDNATSGTWQMVGIIAKDLSTSTTPINFNDPKTWGAWDVATVVLGKPWVSTVPGMTTCK